MSNIFEIITVGLFVFCYFTFGLKSASRYIDNHMGKLFQSPKKCWLKYVLIAIGAFLFAYIEFIRLSILGVLKLLRLIAGL